MICHDIEKNKILPPSLSVFHFAATQGIAFDAVKLLRTRDNPGNGIAAGLGKPLWQNQERSADTSLG